MSKTYEKISQDPMTKLQVTALTASHPGKCRVCHGIGWRNLGEVRGAGYTQLVECSFCDVSDKLIAEWKERKQTCTKDTLPTHIWNPRANYG